MLKQTVFNDAQLPDGIDVVPATPELIDEINVSIQNELEMLLLPGDHKESLKEVAKRECGLEDVSVVIRYMGVPRCYLGVRADESDFMGLKSGRIYAACSYVTEREAILVCRTAKVLLDALSRNFIRIYNVKHSAFKDTLRWLKMLGFTVSESELLAADGTNLLFFEKTSL